MGSPQSTECGQLLPRRPKVALRLTYVVALVGEIERGSQANLYLGRVWHQHVKGLRQQSSIGSATQTVCA